MQQFAVKFLVGVCVALLFSVSEVSPQTERLDNLFAAYLIMVVIAPVVETLFLQALPIEATRISRLSRVWQFLSGWIPFAALHFSLGIVFGVAAGVVGGAFFSHTYLECRSQSVWTSLSVTTLVHGIHNFVAVSLAIIAMN